ncbi:DinB family protein [Phenylobacterium sp.]|uniref:DinB family protein n=1 Tax=Phenylobacterium sp. TaxID=1871053 RepID=UPI0039C9A38B
MPAWATAFLIKCTRQRCQVAASTRAAALLHVFNHATHHRGQISAAISMLGFEFQPLDLPYPLFSERPSSPMLATDGHNPHAAPQLSVVTA